MQWTTDVLLCEFWLYSYVATQDRSPETLSTLIACAKDSQIPYYLSRAMDDGLTQWQVAEVITHCPFCKSRRVIRWDPLQFSWTIP